MIFYTFFHINSFRGIALQKYVKELKIDNVMYIKNTLGPVLIDWLIEWVSEWIFQLYHGENKLY
jgi:hypothetical protein